MADIQNLINKNVRDFTPDDTVYITRMDGKYSIHYYCKFNRIENGCIVGNALSCQPHWGMHSTDKGKEVKARISKCYLFGKDEKDEWARCHWFTKEGITH